MPLPSPNSGESKKAFMSRCMSDDAIKKEFTSRRQRVAVCLSKSEKENLSKSLANLAESLKAGAFPKYDINSSEPDELIECKSSSVLEAQEHLDSCRGLFSRSARIQCIYRVAKKACKKHNSCALDLGLNNQILFCGDYANRTAELYKEELGPTLMNEQNNTSANVDPTAFNLKIKLGSQTFNVDTAITPIEKKKGLMHNMTLKEDQGMLFFHDEEGQHSMWMKNTPLPLTIIWINKNQTVVDIQDAEPCATSDCPDYTPKAPAMYVLEVNKGSFTGSIGDRLHIKKVKNPENSRPKTVKRNGWTDNLRHSLPADALGSRLDLALEKARGKIN